MRFVLQPLSSAQLWIYSSYTVSIVNIVSKDTTKLGLMPQEIIFTSFYEDLQVFMRNRYLALTNQITVFVTTMI